MKEMKRIFCLLVFLLALTVPARAQELPRELRAALPPTAERLLEDVDETGGVSSLNEGLAGLFRRGGEAVQDLLRERVKAVVLILLVVLLCSLADGCFMGKISSIAPMAGALSITLLSVGNLHALIGLGAETITELSQFSKVLLPTLAAATAASGNVGTATVQQLATVFFVDLLLSLCSGLLLPLVYLYIGALTASVMLPDTVLTGVAGAIKKAVTWILTGSLLLFTAYLTLSSAISGATDAVAVKLAKMAISGAVPVVGGIISDATEMVFQGAGVLKNTIGVFGMLAVLATCLYPFLNLAIQYLLYKLAGFVAGTVGSPPLVKLLTGLGGVFGLVLGMTGACALLLMISILSSVTAVVP